jgi:bacterioferritin-associated ferredoxin
MIICSCNVLSDDAIRSCLDDEAQCPRTPGQVQRCLGCRAKCGACFPTIRAILQSTLPPAETKSAIEAVA